MVEATSPFTRGFGTNARAPIPTRGRGRGSKNKHWPPSGGSDNERWERGGHRGGGRGRGRGRGNLTATFAQESSHQTADLSSGQEDLENETEGEEQEADGELPLDATQEEREEFWRELVKAREAERKRAIAEGAMDDPSVPKRLEDAITMVGTCMDMCPRFERYRRERENNLTEFEFIPGTKRVAHRKAVKMYERAAGDKSIPSDLRPPIVLRKTLDYLFGVLLEEKGFSAAHNFIRDRSRAVRNDFTMQHETGQLAIECHDRCARYHILAMHFLGEEPSFLAQEDRLLMNTLQSLKEFYEDQRGKFESPTELEMRVYHRLIHIRDQRERHDDIPPHILGNPVFTLITEFRQHVQQKSAPITKVSQLKVGDDGMAIFAQLAQVLQEQNNIVMVYLIACILERIFGKGAIQDDLESIRGDLSISDIIDGISQPREAVQEDQGESTEEFDTEETPQPSIVPTEQGELSLPATSNSISQQISSVFGGSTPSPFGIHHEQDLVALPPKNAFSALVSTPTSFGANPVFGGMSSMSVFGGDQHSSVFAQPVPISIPPLPEYTPEPMLQSHHPNGPASSQTPSFFLPVQTVQPTPPATKSEAPFAFSPLQAARLPQPQPPLSDTIPSPFNVSLNPNAPAFVPLNPSPPVSQIPSTSPPKAIQPVPAPKTFPSSTAQLEEPYFPLPSHPLEEALATSPARLVERRQTLWDLPGTSGPRRPPRINTDLASGETTSSPKIPPLLKKAEPISLPPTTPHTPPSSHPSLKLNRSLKGFPSIQSIQTPADILSPLNLTPSVNAREFSFTIPACQQPEVSTAIRKLDSIATEQARIEEGKRDKEKRSQWINDAKEKATRFRCRGVLVKNCFSRWKRELMKQVEYLEAVKKSGEYTRGPWTEREPSASISISSSGGDRKRRVSGMSPDAAQKKRARKRLSIKYAPPRTEDDLVRSLRENHEENERRWAAGTFTRSLRERLGKENLPPNWVIWLSINQDNDGTAIWLQRKFDVPSSGTWFSDKIFQIGAATSTARAGGRSPGLIIFECTPFEDLEDELEMKYRILDDCARLREILLMLPEGRHFKPSLLMILWSERQPSILGSDLQDTVSDLVSEGILKSFSTLAMATSMKDADSKFSEAVSSIELDLAGELAVKCTGSSLVRSLSMEWMANLSEWTESCSVDGRIDWVSYGEVLQASSRIMDSIAYHVTTISTTKTIRLPILVAGNVQDCKSAFEAIASWLEDPVWMQVSSTVLMYIRPYEASGADFSITDFSSRLPQLLSATLGIACGRTFHTSIYIVKEEYDDLFKEFGDLLRSENDALVESRSMRNSRLIFKRPLLPSNGSEGQSSYKRARTAQTLSPTPSSLEEPPSPSSRSSSITRSFTPTKHVTLDMLRDLTKSVMKSYQT